MTGAGAEKQTFLFGTKEDDFRMNNRRKKKKKINTYFLYLSSGVCLTRKMRTRHSVSQKQGYVFPKSLVSLTPKLPQLHETDMLLSGFPLPDISPYGPLLQTQLPNASKFCFIYSFKLPCGEERGALLREGEGKEIH